VLHYCANKGIEEVLAVAFMRAQPSLSCRTPDAVASAAEMAGGFDLPDCVLLLADK
jgi:hypothetical protein